MSNDEQQKPVADEVLRSIRDGEVKKRPRRYFVVRGLLNVAIAATAAAFLLHLTSLIMFGLRQHGVVYAPSFGVRGWLAVFGALPVDLLLYTILFVVFLLFVTRRYPVVYRRPLLLSGLGLGLSALLAGYFFAVSPLHARVVYFLDDVPLIGHFTRHHRVHRLNNLHRGTVVEVREKGLLIRETESQPVAVEFGPSTHFPDGTQFGVGDEVFVLGERSNGTIRAVGIDKLSK
jgi:hypothetical protein